MKDKSDSSERRQQVKNIPGNDVCRVRTTWQKTGTQEVVYVNQEEGGANQRLVEVSRQVMEGYESTERGEIANAEAVTK